MGLLENLWCGNIAPADRPVDRGSGVYQSWLRVGEAGERLMETLSPEQRALFLDYESLESANAAAREAEAFGIGFRLAVQLLLAGLQPEGM